MHTFKTTALAVSAFVLLALGACGDMSRQQKNTAIGAGVGAAAGAVLTGGSVLKLRRGNQGRSAQGAEQ